MRKLTLFFMINILFLVLLGSSSPGYDGILLRDFPPDSILKNTLQLRDKEIVNEFIILPEKPFDEQLAATIINNIRLLPITLLNKIQHNEIYIKLFEGKLTDNPTAQHLQGIIPRGYKSDKRWDDVPGIGGGQVVLVKIGHSDKGMGHGSVNLELHELAHSVDRIVYDKLRFDPLFLKIWTKEKHALFSNRAYLTSLPEEYFAESFAMYYLDEKNNRLLKELAPETYEYIKNLK